jgi:YHS domain-containing protein
MWRLILFVFLLLVLFITLQYLVRGMAAPKKKSTKESEPEELVRDPYCQTYIPKRSAIRKRLSGKDYYFCKQESLKKFIKNEHQ